MTILKYIGKRKILWLNATNITTVAFSYRNILIKRAASLMIQLFFNDPYVYLNRLLWESVSIKYKTKSFSYIL